ncbi:MAG: energy-coupling factor transporter transmembrane protein EcfT [Oscillospiraceae bacterium]|nr:energy-coupling factor transporter transmembrane protein EcfT [Oscillospiraceae bacterium]
MLSDVTLGQYVPGESFIHRLDARVKIILVFVYTCALFAVKTPAGCCLYAVFTFICVFVSGVPFRFILRGLRPMLFILVFTAALNIFMNEGNVIATVFEYKGFALEITDKGIYTAAIMAARLLLLLAGTSLLTLTTTPIMLTDAVEYLLKPLKRIGVPAHEAAMMMTVALRFIPTLAEEADRIIKAQKARGADFESGNIIKRARAMLPVMIPLFIGSFRRADELATAMDARCYNGGENRTRMRVMRATKRDAAAAAAVAALVIGAAAAEILGRCAVL